MTSIFEQLDSGPEYVWYETDDAPGTIRRDGFGDQVVVVDVPDDLWEQYLQIKKQIKALLAHNRDVQT